MKVIMVIQVLMLMGVRFPIAFMDMKMAVCMGMLMGMLQCNCVFYHQNRADCHNKQSRIKLPAGPFPQQQHTEYNSQKRRNSSSIGCITGTFIHEKI